MDPLDNPFWHALTGAHARFADTVDGLAARYETEVAAFAALPDEPDQDAWDALRTLVGPGNPALLLRRHVAAPESWETLMVLDGFQMVSEPVSPATDDGFDDGFDVLGAEDVPEMLKLVERTRPGPFFSRTHELGTYLGYRADDGTLVAMAGERTRPPGYAEVSAVCTDDEYRGRGLASRLVRAVGARMAQRGDVPMLHVLADNPNAVRLYESVGYAMRASFTGLVARAPR